MKTKNELIELREKYLSPSLGLSYDVPLYITKGRGQYLFDQKGKKYLDCINNIQHIGHSHPRILNTAYKQFKELNTNTRYLDENIINYAQDLVKTVPKNLEMCFFTNSGSESNDLALRLARHMTGYKETIVFDGAYHGHLISLIEISPYKYKGKGGMEPPDYVYEIPMPDQFRGKYRGKNSTDYYLKELAKSISKIKSKNRIPIFIYESFMGCGGQLVLPIHFLKKAQDLIREAGGICIADEVQIGFGRIGTHFWGFEYHGVEPDIVTLGKSIGNGHPLSVVITSREIANNFHNGMEYFNSFGGNPVSAAIGHEVLRVIKEEKLQQNASLVGSSLKSMLMELKNIHDIIGDVRGEGLFLGIEIVDNKKSLKPLTKTAKTIVNQMKDHGVLLSTDGPENNVIKIKPPMVFNSANAEFLIESLHSIFSKI